MEWSPAEYGSTRGRAGVRIALLVAAVVGVVALAGAAALLLGRGDLREGAVALPSPEVVTTDGSAADITVPRSDIDQIARQVVDVRGLALRDTLDVRLLDRDELLARLRELTEPGGSDLAAFERMLVTARLLPAAADLEGTFDRIYGETVIGLYASAERRLYVAATEEGLTPAVQWITAHEIVHALQDQTFDLEARFSVVEDRADAELALIALLEGDAVLTQEAWSRRFQTGVDRNVIGEELGPQGVELSRAPPYVREWFQFPYTEGARFVVALFEHGGFEAVDAALRDPPTTTAEILDPDRYITGTDVADVTVEGAPGDDWEEALEREFGAFDLRQLLSEFGEQRSTALASTWAGGRARSWHRADETAIAIVLRFTTEDAAAEVCRVLPNWWVLAAGGSQPDADGLLEAPDGWAGVTCEADWVRLVVGPDRDTVVDLREADSSSSEEP